MDIDRGHAVTASRSLQTLKTQAALQFQRCLPRRAALSYSVAGCRPAAAAVPADGGAGAAATDWLRRLLQPKETPMKHLHHSISLASAALLLGALLMPAPALAAGQYTFNCTVHPNMTGTVTAQ